MFTHIHIPQVVREELEEFFSAHEQLQKALQDGFLVVHTIQSSVILKQFLNVLHQGEAEALCLYMEQQAALCLVDEKDARAFATMNGINISGTLGILIQAKQRDIIDAVKPLMDTLRTQHYFWISEPMYQLVLRLSSEI